MLFDEIRLRAHFVIPYTVCDKLEFVLCGLTHWAQRRNVS